MVAVLMTFWSGFAGFKLEALEGQHGDTGSALERGQRRKTMANRHIFGATYGRYDFLTWRIAPGRDSEGRCDMVSTTGRRRGREKIERSNHRDNKGGRQRRVQIPKWLGWSVLVMLTA